MPTIVPHLWYTAAAEEAARFYASVLPDSSIKSVTSVAAESPSGPPGSVKVVEFTLCGQPMMAIGAGPFEEFNHAISLMILCDTQEEIDRYWTALAEDGSVEDCGWVRDRYGLSWQITSRKLQELMRDPDREKARRVADAMLKMQKIEIAALEAAAAER